MVPVDWGRVSERDFLTLVEREKERFEIFSSGLLLIDLKFGGGLHEMGKIWDFLKSVFCLFWIEN